MIHIKSPEEIEMIANSGKILDEVLKKIINEVEVGISLSHLNELASELIKKAGAKPAFLGYQPDGAKHPYHAAICTSVNEVVVHGFPSDYQLKSGDVLKLDFGVLYKNFYSDAAITIGVGEVSDEAKHLIKITKLALDESIKQAKVNNNLEDIGWIIQKTAQSNGLKVIKELTGHGIGFKLHEEPTIYNFGEKGKGVRLKPGMVLAIEPMVNTGTWECDILNNGWTAVTKDRLPSAHFEHTVAITDKGPQILTA